MPPRPETPAAFQSSPREAALASDYTLEMVTLTYSINRHSRDGSSPGRDVVDSSSLCRSEFANPQGQAVLSVCALLFPKKMAMAQLLSCERCLPG